MTSQPAVRNTEYLEERYQNLINYYWKASKYNKRYYKLTRTLTVIVGALVTLISSLSSSKYLGENLEPIFDFATPVSAAVLTVVAGFSQTFQWGAAWQNMVMTATHLEKERDRFRMTPPEERDLAKEAAILNDYVLMESREFFERLLGSAKSVQPPENED